MKARKLILSLSVIFSLGAAGCALHALKAEPDLATTPALQAYVENGFGFSLGSSR